MKILYLCLGFISLLMCAGCGSSSSGGVPGFIPKGNFSNASLSGQYVYQIQGFDFSTNTNGVAYREAGVFTANGAGVITAATDDFSEGNTFLTTNSTGVYAINVDGTGTLSLNNALGTITLAVTMVSGSKVYLVEADSALNAGGLGEKQDPTAIAAAPAGTFVFREHDLNAVQSVASVGAFTVATGVVSNGNEDVNRAGTLSSLTFIGSFNAPDTTLGRGTGTFTDNSPATSSFVYYIVDANNIRFMASTVGVNGLGRAELQSGTPALSGSYAFGSQGDTGFIGGVNMAGRFSASAGAITAGARDFSQDGVTATNISFTGTYTQAPNGRTLATLTTTVNSNLVIWMVNPARGLFIVNDPNTVQDGSLDLQQSASFSNSSMNGQYGFVMDGFDGGGAKDRVGTLQWDGSGKLILNEVTNAAGTVTGPIVLSGNYAVSANGRTPAAISSLSTNLVFYLISGNDAYVTQNDSGVQINGTISKQQ
jgi:hypothetical protein